MCRKANPTYITSKSLNLIDIPGLYYSAERNSRPGDALELMKDLNVESSCVAIRCEYLNWRDSAVR